MRIGDRDYRTLWPDADGRRIHVIDQTKLPHHLETVVIGDCDTVARAISDMVVRGAPLIGVTGAYGLALVMADDPSDAALEAAYTKLLATRPTASNLRWALDRVRTCLAPLTPAERRARAFAEAALIADEDAAACEAIGTHGLTLIRALAEKNPGRPVNIMTHCNAGWLATIDWGTALAPIYKAVRAGIPVHVWVSETRPRNQGALTAFEMLGERVPHTFVVDNAAGHIMQHGQVDMCIVGTDRVTRTGDVCNKIGTYLKALAAHANNVPFYVGLPSSTIDWQMRDGVAEIPIEQRNAREVTHVQGATAEATLASVRVSPEGSPAGNYAFDVTPAHLVTALVTERGICPSSEAGLRALFPDLAPT